MEAMLDPSKAIDWVWVSLSINRFFYCDITSGINLDQSERANTNQTYLFENSLKTANFLLNQPTAEHLIQKNGF